MGDWSIVKRTVKNANELSNSKDEIANFIISDTGQKIYLITREQLNLLGIKIGDASHAKEEQ